MKISNDLSESNTNKILDIRLVDGPKINSNLHYELSFVMKEFLLISYQTEIGVRIA